MGAQMKSVVDMLLTNVSNGLFEEEGYICEKVFPTIEVDQLTGKLAKYGTRHLAIEHSLMGGRGEARRVQPITRSQSTYSLEPHGLEGMVTPTDRANVLKPYDAEKDETLGVTNLILQGKEYALANSLGSTSIMTLNTTLAGTSQWSDYAGSSPLEDAKTAMAAVKAASGVVPNSIILSWEVKNVLKYHPQILDQLGFKYNQAGLIGEVELARAFDVQKVYVAKATYESAKEGQSSSLAPIWGKNMVFAYLPESAKPYQKSLGYYLRMRGVGSRKVYKYAINNPADSTGIQVQDWYQYFLSDVNCGYLVKSCIA